MNFFSNLGDKLHEAANQSFSNFTDATVDAAIGLTPSFLVVGDPPKSNLTGDQVASGMRGSNASVAPIDARDTVASDQLQNGFGVKFQKLAMGLGPIGIIGVAIVAAFILRKKRK